MEKFEEKICIDIAYPIEAISSSLGRSLIFDIETTGLSPASSQLYMIASLALEGDECIFTQWFADDLSSEQDVLKSFFEYAVGFDTLIHYNGDTFDIPFLDKCALSYHILSPLRDMKSIDIYKLIRPYRKLFGVDRLNQKSIEEFTGLHRSDKYSGGELIAVYHEYVETHESELLDMLLLHNREDVLGLAHILSVLSYKDCFNGCFDSISSEREDNSITLTCALTHPVPVHVHTSLSPVSMDVSNDTLTITLPLYVGTMKHFFDDYKNYYYLPAEDMAIHKSVGGFVSGDARIKATAKNAYIKKDGVFIPVFGPTDQPVFYEDYKSSPRYVLLDDMPMDDSESLRSYVLSILSYMGLH